MGKTLQTSGKKRFIDGYTDDVRMAGPNHLAPPSVNCDITKTGEAIYGKGFISTVDLGNAGHASRPFHVSRHNVTFFAINGKVLFVNHNNSNAVVDTGLSLTETDGRKTRFGEYAGDIYLTNRTDGLRQIHMGKVNDAAATLGDGFITVDQDLAGRLLAFGDGGSSLRIANSTPFAETMTSVAATGVVTLANTLDAAVPDNTIVYTVEDISSGRPKGSGITFWKERMIVWGVVYDEGADTATNMVYMSSFASLVDLQNIIDFDVANTAAKEMIGKGGTVTNVLSTRDYLYMFTENETYYGGEEQVNRTTGGMPAQLLTNLYGCVNEDCAADLGNGQCAFLTNNNRIMGIKIATETGAPVVFPDESFDSPISNTVRLLDSDQSNSFLFYAPNEHRLYGHCDVDNERIVLKHNTEIGRWEPPRTGWSHGGMFVRDAVTYATELTDDDVWQLNEGFQNNGIDYEVVMATSLIESDDGRTTLALDNYGISGRIGALTTITAESVVGGGTAQQKSFAAGASVSVGALGSVSVGSTTLGAGIGEDMEEYDKIYGIFPKYGQSLQIRVRSLANVSGGAFSLSSYTVNGRVLSKPLINLQ
jgi:hypothetical protein